MNCSPLPFRIYVAPRPTGGIPMIERALIKAAYEFGVTREQILGESRKANIYNARVCFAMICRKVFLMSLESTGRVLSRNHTTIMNMIENAENWQMTYWNERYKRVEAFVKSEFERH